MREHKMTISGLHTPGSNNLPSRPQVPLLLLSGAWLQDAGFCPGAKVRVDVVEDGRLVVTRADTGDEGREWQPVVRVPADQIGRIEDVSARRVGEVSHV